MPKPWDATSITLTLWNVVELYGCLFEPLNDICMKSLLGETSETPTCYLLKFGCMCTFCGAIIFKMIMIFSVNVVNTKVVGNFII